jgi:hypothetical protein
VSFRWPLEVSSVLANPSPGALEWRGRCGPSWSIIYAPEAKGVIFLLIAGMVGLMIITIIVSSSPTFSTGLLPLILFAPIRMCFKAVY